MCWKESHRTTLHQTLSGHRHVSFLMMNSNPIEAVSAEGVELVSAPFGLDLKEIREVASLGIREKAERKVCVCGHSVGSHGPGYRSRWLCSSGKMTCPCQDLFPVLEVSDLRHFHFKTEGWGPRHALALGTQKCLEKGGKVTQIVSNNCFVCGKEAPRLIPTSMTLDKLIVEIPGPLNALLCQDCWSDLPIRGY